ncbi:MAG: electron transfer flavoprotein subunit alpha/FixB family protein [Desulfobacteraceae bacterium]|nr:electron transfer flavoprotein subunit alpha/FixB family protein [Desulfobacteraceae bacterium]
MKRVAVVVEHDPGGILPVTHELMACAKILADHIQAEVVAVIPGEGDPAMAKKIAGFGVETIDLAITGADGYNSEAWKEALHRLFTAMAPLYIIVGHTAPGRDFAPGLGVRLGGGSIAGVNNIVLDQAGPLFSRPVLNGAQNAIVRPEITPCIVMVQPGAFRAQGQSAARPGRVIGMEIMVSGAGIQPMGVKSVTTRGEDLDRAAVIVAAGRGIRERENLDLIGRFAALFPNSVVGASRPLVDDGWMEYRFQVGITGARVSPKLYIACGISGSSQHLAGITGSELIVSVNADPNAAIFNHSDICIVADLFEFIPSFERLLERHP